jgi:hypothetical protein
MTQHGVKVTMHDQPRACGRSSCTSAWPGRSRPSTRCSPLLPAPLAAAVRAALAAPPPPEAPGG